MRRYEYFIADLPRLSDRALLVIAEDDPSPTSDELDEGEQLSRLLLLGDSSIRLHASERHPDVFNVVRVGPASLKPAA